MKMQLLLKYPYKWLAILLLLFIAVGSSAQKVAVISKVLDGSQGRLVKGAAINVYDSAFLHTDASKLNASYSVKNIITFHINEYSDKLLPDSFTAFANIRIIYLRPDKHTDSIEQTLKINYSDSIAYTNRSSFVFNNSHDVTLRLLGISITRDSARVSQALLLENEMDIQAVYNLTCNNDTVQSIAAVPTANTDSTDELTVTWTEVTGADEYDLEWTFVDTSALIANKYGSPVNALLLFRNNATRVTVKNNSYNIPLFFEGPGTLFFRVRAVQDKANSARLQTAWTPANPGSASFEFGGHQRKLNWQANIAFAEEGKRNVTVDYFDGSLRNRQTVTKDNTTNTTIVAETMYDHQGRAAIQVMPAPTLNTVIRYSSNFNRAISGEYDKSNYDSLAKVADFLSASAAKMSTASGANQYYSSDNPQKDLGNNRFIPDAGGYAFTETSYTQDGTGRISRKSGVGEVFKLGSNHETKYYYGSPADNDLDILFGTEAGDKSHYFKNTVQDANGQMAVTYVDMHGRTVATALAGSADSAQLDDLESNIPYVVIDTLSRAGSNTVKDMALESSQSILATMDSVKYNFHYAVMPPVLRKKICDKDSTICYNALYDLEIRITDDAFNQKIRNGLGFDTVVTNFNASTISPVCSPDSLKVDFTLMLPKGSYQVTKRLTINSAGLAYYRDNIFLKYNTCRTLEEYIQIQRKLLARTQCIPTCQACQDSVGDWNTFRANYMLKGGIAVADSASLRGEALTAYQAASEACDALCDTLSPVAEMRKALLADVTPPSGQYATLSDSAYLYSIYYHQGNEVLAPYRRDTVTFYDEAGNIDSVYDAVSGKYVLPRELDPEEFAKNFKSSWAASLLKFHPEYCRFLAYQQFDKALVYNRKMEKVSTYQEAKANGYMNPYDTTAFPFTGGMDPIKNVAGIRKSLYDKLNNYNAGAGTTSLSMYSMATILAKCTEAKEACVNTYKTPALAFSESALCTGDLDAAWRNFRQLYINYKKHLIDSIVQAANCSGYPTAQKLAADTMTVHFPKESDAYAMAGITFKGNDTTGNKAVKDSMAASYAANCNSYVSTWTAQLLKCTYYTTKQLEDSIIPKLKAVCREGSDSLHILGSSTTKPGSTYQYKSFEDVINLFNLHNGINAKLKTAADTMNCNSLVITAPAPYDKQRAYSDKVSYAKPTACECEKLHVLQVEYNKYKAADVSLAAYLNRTRGTSLTETQVNLLLEACDASKAGCTYMSSELIIPPLIQCNTAPACATCDEVNALNTIFNTTYPGLKPTLEELTPEQHNMNAFYAAYMNNATGYSKEAYEYLGFIDTCIKYKNTVAYSSVCVKDSSATENSMHTYSNGNVVLFNDVATTNDGGFLLAGYARKNPKTTSTVNNAYLVRTDSLGNVIWAKQYGSTINSYFQRVRATFDGGFIAIGSSGASSSSTVLIVKVNSDGGKEWAQSLATDAGAAGTDILQTADSGYVFAARRHIASSPLLGEIGKLSSTGEKVWLKQHQAMSGNLTMEGFSLALDGDVLAVAGCFLQTSYTKFKMFVNKLNATSGEFISNKTYAKNLAVEGNYSKHIFNTSYGFLFNFTSSNVSYNPYINHNIVVGVDRDGNVKYRRQFGNYFGKYPTQWMPVAPTADGGMIGIQNLQTKPHQIVWTKLDANYNHSWSDYMQTSDSVDIQMVKEVRNNKYAAVGCIGANGLLLLNRETEKFGCNDSMINNNPPIDTGIIVSSINWSENSEESTYFPKTDNTIVETDLSSTTIHGRLNCAVTSCYSLYTGPLLCGNATAPFPNEVDTITGCTDDDFYAISAGTQQFNAYRDSLYAGFGSEYVDTALEGGKKELFTVVYKNSEYHYTLFYYDQAGNLVKTIPPAGVVVDRSPEWAAAVRAARMNGVDKVPAHTMATQYRYNSLNEVVATISPDGGRTTFWYDRLGRVVFSQNAQQALTNKYFYSIYDALGRVTEDGELTSQTPMTNFISRDTLQYAGWLANAAGSRTQIVKTVYDIAYDASDKVLKQENLRNRISWKAVFDDAASLSTSNGMEYSNGTFYSYDIHGNVKSLLKDFKHGNMLINGNRFKIINYQYDLINSKVKFVAYQPGQKDAFYHRYSYDDQNRLTNVETSHDSIYWENDVWYQYYKHGFLAREVIGQQQVQGIDHAYTLQGWVKGVNSSVLNPSFDMGSDGASGSQVAKDVFGFGIHYFGNREYVPVNTAVKPFAAAAGNKPLFTGNISAISQNISSLGTPLEYTYSYDVLNRLKGMVANRGMDSLTNSWTNTFTALPDFKEAVTYDANGNILTYNRNGNKTFAGSPLGMDSLSYHYRPGTNKLSYLTDLVDGGNYGNDIDNQIDGNYKYDSIGNVVSDLRAGVDSIRWNVYGKIAQIYKHDTTSIVYTYDAAGNRISKSVINKTKDSVQTFYVRDATGNILSVYSYRDTAVNKGQLSQTEVNLYGSSRLGMSFLTTNVQDSTSTFTTGMTGLGYGKNITFIRGKKSFELTNHLGNVLATVSDRKTGVSLNNYTIDSYIPIITSAQEYYPFGMLMPGRGGHIGAGKNGVGRIGGDSIPAILTVTERTDNKPSAYTATGMIVFETPFVSGDNDEFTTLLVDPSGTGAGTEYGVSYGIAARGYRYGFNGKENDGDVKGEGNEQDYGMRIYDPRAGKFLSVDPITRAYPELTPYQFASNRPIDGVDLDGKEYKNKSYYYVYVTTQPTIKIVNNSYVLSESLVMKVGANKDNAPDYFKKHNLRPEPASIQGYDDPAVTGSLGYESMKPDFTYISAMGDAGLADSYAEPNIHMFKDKGLAPEPVPTAMTGYVYTAAELTKNFAFALELFLPSRSAKIDASEDKRTFYYSINLVNNFYKERDATILPVYKNLFTKAQLINFVNAGVLPYSWEEINRLKNSTSQLDQMTARHYEAENEFIKEAGKQIYDTRTNKRQEPVTPPSDNQQTQSH